MEGGSIGITQNSKVHNMADAHLQMTELMQYHEPPILCEEFVGGREISFCVVGSDRIVHIEAMEVTFDGEDGYFHDKLFSMHDKRSKERQRQRRFRNVTKDMPKELVERVKLLYLSLGKVIAQGVGQAGQRALPERAREMA